MIPTRLSAQYQHQIDPFWSNLRNKGRYEIGGGLVMPSGSFTGVVTVLGSNNYYRGDSTAKRDIKGTGFGGSIGLALPFRATGHISCWAIAVQLQGNIMTWPSLNQTMSTGGTYTDRTTKLDGSTMQFALPIGVDYKVGNDAILTQRLPLGMSIGAGIYPQITLSTLSGVSGYKSQWGNSIWPYAKLDLSVFTGFCWKIRLMYTAGNMNLLDQNTALAAYNQGPFTISSSGQFMASLIIMPFSGKWSEYAWYNTYDTYNQYDRFN
ncbi:hypothetical protein GCM10023093_23870 [Nemorincola caseinilytica]|uniref:Outer membrane protein beta-barrel domain-containing protein n=1 Tax=Nemorincola caseinilytica TaxID=2054315 RepID=A0ABP8NHY8_9BACT